MIFAFFFLFLVSLATEKSVSSSLRVKCRQPVWNVVGNHYAERENCDYFFATEFQRLVFREKYFEELVATSKGSSVREINSILDRLMILVDPTRRSLEDELTCVGCSAAIDTYRLLSTDHTVDEVLVILKNICVDFNIMSDFICETTLQSYGRILMKITDLTNKTSSEMCSLIFNTNCGGRISSGPEWSVAIPGGKPPVVKPNPVPETEKHLKVLHLTDTHWDPKYVEGTWSECKLPLCCRKETPLPDSNASKAGKYGGWKCDMPEATFDDFLRHASEQHPDVDYILWTGDLPPHDIWDQSKSGSLNILKKSVDKLKKFFPKTPIFPALGNHESVPPNMFPWIDVDGDKNPMEWLYDELNVQWKNWLPENVTGTVRTGAFYTTLIRPGFRLVSMNTNFCYKFNWWLIISDDDPVNELKWLTGILEESERNKEIVHIVGHISPGSKDCLKTWKNNYNRIIERFEGTVTGQFFGHTHTDLFELYYDTKMRPIGVGYVAPSLTTYTYRNPSYRIYRIQGDGKETKRFVLDHETWHFDLEKANQRNETEWRMLYSAKSDYNMTSLHPADWNALYEKMAKSKDLLDLYNKYYWSDYAKRPACDEACRRKLLCEIRSCTQYGEPTK